MRQPCLVKQLTSACVPLGRARSRLPLWAIHPPLAAATAFGIVGLFSATSVMGSGLVAERFGYRQTVTASIAGTVSGMGLLIALTLAPSWFLMAAATFVLR